MVFPVVTYACESWTIKKAECQRIDAFELWCWRRLLRAPWTARRCNQSILKETSPGISLEGMILKLKLQYFGHLMQRDPDSLRAALSLGGEAPAWECSLGRFLSLGKSSPRGRLWQRGQFFSRLPLSLGPLSGECHIRRHILKLQ